MGILRGIFDAARVANEDAHGDRLLCEVQSTFSTMEKLDSAVQYKAIKRYLQIRERLIGQMPNMSRDGHIKLGKTMRLQARNTFDIDMSGGYAKWLGGAWLESGARNSLKARQAHELLEEFADHMRKKID